jgi:cell division protein ZapA (FtsZ GTPase activity inhibitor)
LSELEVNYESNNLLFDDRDWDNFVIGGGDLMEIKIAFSILVAFIIIISSLLFMHEYSALKSKISDIEKRMIKLEAAKNKRMPYAAMEEILDARAALNREKEEFQLFISFIENAEAHLDKAVATGTKREKGE